LTALGVVICAAALFALAKGPPGLGEFRSVRHPVVQPPVHLAATYDGHVLRLYVDGRLRQQRPVRRRDRAANRIQIGAFGSGAGWVGSIDDVALYRRALPPATVANHHRIGTTPPGSGGGYPRTVLATGGLISYWSLGSKDRDGRAVDARGGASGVYERADRQPAPALFAGNADGAAAFDGTDRAISIAPSPALSPRRAFTVEAWAQSRVYDNHVVIAQPGSFYVKTDPFGSWTAGLYARGRPVEVRAPAPSNRTFLSAPSHKPTPDPGLLALLAGCLVMIAGGLRALDGKASRRARPLPPLDPVPARAELSADDDPTPEYAGVAG
jgi:hypothetical protein